MIDLYNSGKVAEIGGIGCVTWEFVLPNVTLRKLVASFSARLREGLY